MKQHFNVLVIGKGLVGSSAAKYLSLHNENIGIIGPDEPDDYKESLVFASHYDQARVQRIIGKDAVWTKLNFDSVQQYETIQEQSGIHFHKPVGCLYVNPYGLDDHIRNAPILSDQFKIPVKTYQSSEEITEVFTDLNFPAGSKGIFQYDPSGLINPRLLVKAQLKIAEQHTAVILNETVLDVSWVENKFIIKTREGNSYTATKVLIAAGSFVNFLNLVPEKLKLQPKSEVILLVKVTAEQAGKLSKLPSVLYEINDHEKEGIYMIQPVQYPNGMFYLKIGCNTPEDIYFENLEQIQHWFRTADTSQYAGRLLHALQTILPGLAITEYFTKKCIISRTPHGRPFIGESAQKGWYVAGGCNGYSAMCSDAIGSVASHLILNGRLPEGFPPDAFELHYQN